VSDRSVRTLALRRSDREARHDARLRHGFGTAGVLALLVTNCDEVVPERVVEAEPAEAANTDSTMSLPLPTQAERNAVAQEEATVLFVIDGDTFEVAVAHDVVERVRLPQSTLPRWMNADTRSRRRR
jgi:endonuclease YncB( thermonuclease family)